MTHAKSSSNDRAHSSARRLLLMNKAVMFAAVLAVVLSLSSPIF